MNQSLKKQLFKTFSQMLADLSTPKEVEAFLQDFFSDKELDSYVKRMAAIYWVKKGRDKSNIKANLNTTNKEIVLAQNIIEKQGIKLAIKKIEADEWANVWSEKIKSFVK